MRSIPEPFPNRVAAFIEQFGAAMEHEDWEGASEFLDRAFLEAEWYLTRTAPDYNPFKEAEG